MRRVLRSTIAKRLPTRRLFCEPLEPRLVLSIFYPDYPNSTPPQYPPLLRHLYGLDQMSFNGVPADGRGMTIAIIIANDDPTIASDLHTFDQQFGLPDPPSFRHVNASGGPITSPPDLEAAGELSLDVEWSHAIAPGANILVVAADSLDKDSILQAIDYARHEPGVVAVSMSFGFPEDFADFTSVDQVFTTPTGHGGVTFIASSGDSGIERNWPADSPNVLAVGGTSLLWNPYYYAGEWGWSGSGGGVSQTFARPAYQNGVSSEAFRTVPDVALDADPRTGVLVFSDFTQTIEQRLFNGQGWSMVGGTSASAPMWAGLIAIANQGRALNGLAPLAGVNSAIYQLPSSDFHDIVQGFNGEFAGPGYDQVTGRGSPVVPQLIQDLVSGPIAASAPTQSPAPAPAVALKSQGSNDRLDVNHDGVITALDALMVINHLNAAHAQVASASLPSLAPSANLDVNGDGAITALDALIVINRLNAPRAPTTGSGLGAMAAKYHHSNLTPIVLPDDFDFTNPNPMQALLPTVNLPVAVRLAPPADNSINLTAENNAAQRLPSSDPALAVTIEGLRQATPVQAAALPPGRGVDAAAPNAAVPNATVPSDDHRAIPRLDADGGATTAIDAKKTLARGSLKSRSASLRGQTVDELFATEDWASLTLNLDPQPSRAEASD